MSAERHASLMERQFEMLVEMKGPQKQPTGDPEMGQTFRTTLRPGGASSKGETIMDQRSLVPKQRASSRPGPLRCLRDCQCRCHYRTVMRSPRYMTEWLGDFFLGCTNLPWCFSGLVACSEQTCRRSWGPTVDVGYLLPSWIGQGVGSFAVTFSLRRPPLNICVRTRHTVPYDSPILVCAQEGDVDGARKLLLSGQATINDVDPYGLGLLYVSGETLLRDIIILLVDNYETLSLTVPWAIVRRLLLLEGIRPRRSEDVPVPSRHGSQPGLG